MIDLQLTSKFTDTIQAAFGEQGAVWLKELPAMINVLSREWQFSFIKPMPNLSYNFVALVEDKISKNLSILKMAADNRILSEIACLRSFQTGVPNIYAIHEQNNAFLMQYVEPGYPVTQLVQSGQDEQATRHLCHAIRQLQSAQQVPTGCKLFSELATDLSALQGHVSKLMLATAQGLFAELCQDCPEPMLLHGDLHHDNLIKDGESWCVIDPHGYLGDPIAEVGAMIRNPMHAFPNEKPMKQIIESRLKILAEELPFDPVKIKAWTFCATMLSAAWNIQDFGYKAQRELTMADIIMSIL